MRTHPQRLAGFAAKSNPLSRQAQKREGGRKRGFRTVERESPVQAARFQKPLNVHWSTTRCFGHVSESDVLQPSGLMNRSQNATRLPDARLIACHSGAVVSTLQLLGRNGARRSS